MKKRLVAFVLAAIMVVSLLPTVALASTDSWSYDANTKTFTVNCTIPEMKEVGDPVPQAVYFSNAQESEDIVFGAGWGKAVEAQTEGAQEYHSKYWGDPGATFASGEEYGYAIAIAYDPEKLGDLSGAKVVLNGKEYDLAVAIPYDSPVYNPILDKNAGAVFLAVDFGTLSADGEFSGGDFEETDNTNPLVLDEVTDKTNPLGLDEVTDKTNPLGLETVSIKVTEPCYLYFSFYSEPQDMTENHLDVDCAWYGWDYYYTSDWNDDKFNSVDAHGWYYEVTKAPTTVTFEGVSPYLYWAFFDSDSYECIGEIHSETLQFKELTSLPAASDPEIEEEDGQFMVTVEVTEPEELEGCTWVWDWLEYADGTYYSDYADIEDGEAVFYADHLEDVVYRAVGHYSYVDTQKNEFTRQAQSAWKLCEDDEVYLTDAGTGARSAIDADGNVYLGGNYIEIGLSKHGCFGTVPDTTTVPNNFHSHWFMKHTDYAAIDHGVCLGLLADSDGWNTGKDPVAGDFFVPGSPYEGWGLYYQIDLDNDGVCETDRVITVADLCDYYGYYSSEAYYDSSKWLVEPITSIVGTGDDNILAAQTVGTTIDGVKITLDYSFGVDDLYYTTEVNITNNSGKTIKNAFYTRDFDPDQDEWFSGNYTTYNKTMSNPDTTEYGGADNNAMVVSRGLYSGAGFFFLSMDNRATAIDSVWVLSQYFNYYDYLFEDIKSWNTSDYTKYDAARDNNDPSALEDLGFIYDDNGLGLLCDFGDVEDGAVDQFVYYSSLDPDVAHTVTKATEAFESDLYTVKFDPNGGTGLTEASAEWKTGMLYDLPTCTKNGLVLAGWMLLDAEGHDTDTIYPQDQKARNITAAGGEATLKAVWAEPCIVSFESEYGIAPAPITVAFGAKATLPDAPEANSCTFLGWEYNGIIYPAGAKLSFPGRSEVTLTAAWKEYTYTVYFDANGGTCVQALKTLGVTDEKYGALPKPTHPYAEFAGWYDYYPAYGNLITENSTAPGSDNTLYADWKGKTYDVTINGLTTENAATYGDNYEYIPGAGTYDVTVTIGGETYYPINNEGVYTVAGWAITGDIVITSEKVGDDYVTLIYLFNGDPVYTTVALKTDEYPEVPLPEMEGYTVDGWYADGYYMEKAEGVIGDGPIVKVYAKPTYKAIPLTFDGEEAEYSPRDYSYWINFPENPSDEAHRKFVGWQGDNGVFYAKDADYTYYMPDVESLNFTSVWQDVGDLTITVKDSNGKVPGATVNLIQNGITKKSAVTDENGKASFISLSYGAYNVAVVSSINETETVTTTVGQNISADNTNLTVNVPTCKRNTLVDSRELGTNLTVENLGNADTTQPNPNEGITITLFAKKAEDANKEAINNKVAEDYKESGIGVQMVDYIDLTVKKTTKTDYGDGNIGTDEVTLSTTKDYQIISVELSDAIYEKLASVNGSIENVLAYRLHGEGAETKIERLKKMPNESAGKKANYECYWMKNVEGKDYVAIKAKNFSTYAIGYQDVEVQAEKTQSSSEAPTYTITYTITGADTENGKLTISWKEASAGQTVTITVKPDEGYKLNTLTVKDITGKELALTKVNDTTYTFMMPSGNVTVSATFTEVTTACPQDETCVYAKFTDADTKAWYHDGVHFCVENGYMQGVSATAFNPAGTTTRAMIVTMLWRMEGKPVANYAMSFKDVKADQWYTEAIRWAQSTGVVKGYSAEAFGPNDPITREQMATILYRYAKYHSIDVTNTNTLVGYTDVNKVSTWALDAMKWANAVGLVQGRSTTTLVPEVSITRAEAATMVQRFCKAFLK